jgi:hypothetical protein
VPNQYSLAPEDDGCLEGGGFFYETCPEIFLRRSGYGPLRIAWGTNILIDYAEFGDLIWGPEDDEDYEFNPPVSEANYRQELVALYTLVQLWMMRDIRVRAPQRQINDAQRELSESQWEIRATGSASSFCPAAAGAVVLSSTLTGVSSAASTSSAASAASIASSNPAFPCCADTPRGGLAHPAGRDLLAQEHPDNRQTQNPARSQVSKPKSSGSRQYRHQVEGDPVNGHPRLPSPTLSGQGTLWGQ